MVVLFPICHSVAGHKAHLGLPWSSEKRLSKTAPRAQRPSPGGILCFLALFLLRHHGARERGGRCWGGLPAGGHPGGTRPGATGAFVVALGIGGRAPARRGFQPLASAVTSHEMAAGRQGAASLARTQDGAGPEPAAGRGREAARRACAAVAVRRRNGGGSAGNGRR